MIVHDEVIRQFIEDKAINESVYAGYPAAPQTTKADPKRKDIVMELHSRILPVLKENRFYNHTLCRELEKSYDEILNRMHVHLMVNAPSGFDIYHTVSDFQDHIFIDLIQIADHTPIVTEMTYILMHHISRLCMRSCIKKRGLPVPESYLDHLDREAFIEGFSLLTAWNEDIQTYPFHKPSYDSRKEHAFGYLSVFIQEEDPLRQKDILNYLKQASFWDACTAIGGMFYLFDIYREEGIQRLISIYEKGYKGFITSIFSS